MTYESKYLRKNVLFLLFFPRKCITGRVAHIFGWLHLPRGLNCERRATAIDPTQITRAGEFQ